MPQILKISDGTTTVDFVTSTSGYAVTRWEPAVAKRRSTMLGGRGPYEDVIEVMEITIHGTAALDRLQTLQKLFEQSTRGNGVNPLAPCCCTINRKAPVRNGRRPSPAQTAMSR